MRRRIIIASIGLAAAAAIGGGTAAAVTGSPAASARPAASAPAAPAAAAAVRTAQAQVGGHTETVLVNAHGLPLYYYPPDTATKSLVTGQLLGFWPPLTAAAPTAAGLGGQLTVVNDVHGSQLAYNGHLLYTFIGDHPGQVTGQGFQNFFVATPGLAPIGSSSVPTGTVPASPSTGIYGY